jgi:hypothetical protein
MNRIVFSKIHSKSMIIFRYIFDFNYNIRNLLVLYSKMLFIRCRNLRLLFSSAKLFSTTTVYRAGLVAELLTGRANVRVAGSEASQFLQGLITNDIHILESNKNGALYTVFLNVQVMILTVHFDLIPFLLKQKELICNVRHIYENI